MLIKRLLLMAAFLSLAAEVHGAYQYRVDVYASANAYDWIHGGHGITVESDNWDLGKDAEVYTGLQTGVDRWGKQTTASASASADLSTGEVSVYAGAVGSDYPNLSVASAYSYFGDYLTFHLPAGTTSAPVTVNLQVTGSYDMTHAAYDQAPSASAYLQLGSAMISDGRIFEPPYARNLPVTFSVTADVENEVKYWFCAGLIASFSAKEYFLTYFDFANTGQISIDLPPGVSYESASGVFLQQGSPAVPEPSTLVLWSGLGAMGLWMAWRRRKWAA